VVIKTGSWVGGLLVDGLGDGAMIEAEGEDLDFLRTTSFGLLQVRFSVLQIRVLLHLRV
jgi:(E)-4-hydroxy-3-methylbut-2-enyl-diphosphate synthase